MSKKDINNNITCVVLFCPTLIYPNMQKGGYYVKKSAVIFFFICSIVLSATVAFAGNPLEELKTPAELSNWTKTTSSKEVVEYLTQVAKNSGGRIRMEFIAWTTKNNLVPLLVIGAPAPKSPKEVPADKAVAYVNCNIHSGEIEGKESMLLFAREVALGKHDELLKDIVILLAPNMSPDGNDDLGTWRRGSQFTPAVVGTRYNGQGFNMNRDMTKLEAYEARAVVDVMNKWDPVIFIDAHATNGSYMRHAVTYNWGLHPNTDPDILAYNRGEFSRNAIGSESYLYKKLGHTAIPYGNFGKNYSGKVSEGWWTFEDYPRYTTNYAGLRNRLAMLLEVYSYDDYKTRVDTQYACIYGILQTVAKDKDKIKTLIKQADEREMARATTGIASDDKVCLNSVLTSLDEIDGGYVSVDSYAVDAGGKVTPASTDYDADGFKTAIHFSAEATHHIPYYGKFIPSGTEKMGALYILRPGADDAVQLLLRHGITVNKLTKAVAVTDFEWFKIDTLGTKKSLYEGHYMNVISGDWVASSDLTIPVGSFVVSTSQIHGSLAALLLEPESVDGLVSWNYLDKLITTEGARYDRFLTIDSVSSARVVFPMWKLGEFNVIPASSLIPVNKLAYDETLPDPIESLEPYTGNSSSGGCNAGVTTGSTLLLALCAVAVALRRKNHKYYKCQDK